MDKQDTFFIVWFGCAVAIVSSLFLLFVIACAPLQDVQDIADFTRDVKPVAEVVAEVVSDDGPRDWWSIAEKAAYAVAAAAALIGGNEVRKRRKAK